MPQQSTLILLADMRQIDNIIAPFCLRAVEIVKRSAPGDDQPQLGR